MPPNHYFEVSAYMNEYKDGSGYHVAINLWYPLDESDPALQLDIRKHENQLSFMIDDWHVLCEYTFYRVSRAAAQISPLRICHSAP